MPDFIESKFRIDYRNFETLPTQLIKGLDFINSRIRQVEHIKKLKQEIEGLELSIAAETKMIADDILRENVFPRFNEYSDFIAPEFVTQEMLDKHPTFGNFAAAITNGNSKEFKNENKIRSTFEYFLENFIWLFFQGAGAFDKSELKHVVVDYSHCTYIHEGPNNAYPPENSYDFNATNSKNGKSYSVTFTFYDLKKAIDYNYTSRNFSYPYIVNFKPYESIRLSGFGQILCTISRIEKSHHDGEVPDPKKKIFIKSFDPIEIAAFIKHVVAENKGEINE